MYLIQFQGTFCDSRNDRSSAVPNLDLRRRLLTRNVSTVSYSRHPSNSRVGREGFYRWLRFSFLCRRQLGMALWPWFVKCPACVLGGMNVGGLRCAELKWSHDTVVGSIIPVPRALTFVCIRWSSITLFPRKFQKSFRCCFRVGDDDSILAVPGYFFWEDCEDCQKMTPGLPFVVGA